MKGVNAKASVSSVEYDILSVILVLFVILGLWLLSVHTNELSSWLLSVYISISYTNLDYVRNSIGTMIQIQATIIAIVIGLSLTAVQLATSAYSMRLFRSFWRNPWTWSMIVLYVFSIIYNFILLGILENIDGFKSYITLSYLLCFASIILLIPYFYNMAGVLSPESIIKKLSKNIPNAIKFRRSEDWEKEDPFQPIDDLICISLTKYDYKTASIGLEEMIKYVREIVISRNMDEFELMVRYYCSHMERLGLLFLKYDEEKLALKAVHDLESLGMDVVSESKKFSMQGNVLPAITGIGINAGEKGFQEVMDHAIFAMGIIGGAVDSRVGIQYDNFTVPTSDFPDCEEAYAVADFLGKIGKVAVEKWGVTKLQGAADYLGELGVIFAKKRLKFATFHAASSLYYLGVIALKEVKDPGPYNIYDSFIQNYITTPLMNIAKLSHKEGIKEVFEHSASNLWTIGIYATMKDLEKTQIETAKALAELTILNKNSVKRGLGVLKSREKDVESLQSYEMFMQLYRGQLAEVSQRQCKHRKKSRSRL